MNYEVKNVYGKTLSKKITVSVTGSKSITARAYLLAAIANGESTLYGVSLSDDCNTFLNCLKALGIPCSADGATVKIQGCGGRLEKKYAEINVGSAGTAARFLPAFLAFQDGEYKIDCSAQMKARPIAPLISTLENLGASFTFLEKQNCFPFIIKGTASPKSHVSVNIGESSQFLSALLISAVCAKNPVKITVEGSHGLSYVNMTADMLWSFGADVKEECGAYSVAGKCTAKKYDIEPDLSAACYFYAMNKILGTNISVKGVMPHSMQGDAKFIEILKTFNGGKIDMSAFSDQALTLAAIAPYLKEPTDICNIAHIRKQECDRISAICKNLSALGVKTEERADGVKIYPSMPKPAIIQTFGDHRVAMSFALTGLRCDGVIIEDAEVCSKTFKDFFDVLSEICVKLADNN
ncbi:MAG: 3-phosphoshikimate 1-carboxyvinyltransferase [Clostridia bacterium]|nr:3-phosphoshikimate 1-carboxyvinyltransferase [Clostridia bacterium]